LKYSDLADAEFKKKSGSGLLLEIPGTRLTSSSVAKLENTETVRSF
jgi:hypothetical protein